MFISWMLIMPSFKKSLIVEQFQGNYTLNLKNMEAATGEKAPVNDFGRTVPGGGKYCRK